MKRKKARVLVTAFVLLLSFSMCASRISASIASEVTIERFVYDGHVSGDYDEYVKICNISGGNIDLGGTDPWRMGDAETMTDNEGMFDLQGTLGDSACFLVALNANSFNTQWGFLPDYEMNPSSTAGGDNTSVPNLAKVLSFGNWGLSNTLATGDNITLWKYVTGSYAKHDEAAYGTNANRYTEVGLSTVNSYQLTCGANANCALTRNTVSVDTDNMASDFNNTANPNAITFSSFVATSSLVSSWAIGLGVFAAVVVGLAVVVVRRRV